MKKAYLLILIVFNFITYGQTASEWKPVDLKLSTAWTKYVNPDNALTEYPRPQLKRSEWLNLNGLWDYAIQPAGKVAPGKWDGEILVPYAVESALSGVNRKVGKENELWYKKNFELPSGWKNKRIVLRFDAVDWETKVWVNGNYAGDHKGGYDHFSFDITSLLNKDGKQEILISVWDPIDAGTQPRGKQVEKPGGIMYTSVTGIWQTVWLEPLPEANIETLRIIPDIDLSEVSITANCVNALDSYNIEAEVFSDGKIISRGTIKAGENSGIKIPESKLWSPEVPYLYDLIVLLKDDKGKVIDSVNSYFGMRKISLGKDEKGITRIMLNNKFVFQFGFLDQGWWPDGLYTAPTDEALKYDIEMTKKMGFNLARKHVKVEPDRWYFWCDKLGLLVWQDMPSGDEGIAPEDPDITRTEESARQYLLELQEMINEHISNPSIVIWVPFNEGWGQWNTAEVVQKIKTWDNSRLVDPASGWADRGVKDINDLHSYPGPGIPPVEEERAVVLGEFGGLGLPVKGHTWQQTDNWGYITLKNKEDLTNSYTDLIDDLMAYKEQGLSAAVYTQTTDVEVEVNGLMTYDRQVVKIDPEKLTKINAGYLPPAFKSDYDIFLDSLKVELVNVSPSGEVRYTTNGSEPDKNSKLYSAPINLNKTSTIKAKTYWQDGTESYTKSKKFVEVNVREAANVSNLSNGIKYKYYENNGERWMVLPQWNSLKENSNGVTSSIGLNEAKRADDFGLVFEGYIKIPVDGIYSFYIDSDDGSQLFIGDKLIVDNNNQHGMQERYGDIALAKGFHPIRITFFQGMGGKGLTARYKGPGIEKMEMPVEVLFYKN